MFQYAPFLGLLTEPRRDNDKGTNAFLCTEVINIVGTVFGCNNKDGHLCLRDVLGIMVCLDSLHFLFFGVHDVQVTIVATVFDVTYNSAARLVYVVGAANHDDAPWI